jgi:hypothetical protein
MEGPQNQEKTEIFTATNIKPVGKVLIDAGNAVS